MVSSDSINKKVILGFFLLFLLVLPLCFQKIEAAEMKDYCIIPPFVGQSIPPLVMLVMGRDHKLYYEAYNDASDLNEDGKLDVGYNHSIEYYGYFDPYKCYVDGGAGNLAASARFSPVAVSTDKFCGVGQWSGNVLNWLTMSRMDALRKVLFGGYRSTDSASSTVLERVYVPQDAHSWGKEVTGRLCSSGSTYTNQCTTSADCDTGYTCVDKSIELIGIAAPEAPTTCTANPVSWNTTGQILIAKYTHSSTTCGTDHADLINSYEPANYYDHYYVDDFNDPSLDPALDHDGSYRNLFAVVEFEVGAGDVGDWEFAIDGDDGEEVEIDAEVVASYYGCHGPCFTPTATTDPNNAAFCSDPEQYGSKTLSAGWHRLIVRHSESGGWEGVRLWYKKPGDTNWTIFGNTLNLRAPNIAAGNECSIQTMEFIETGEPSTGTIVVGGSAKRHLFCNTSTGDSPSNPPLLRMVRNRPERIWQWASTERAVCSGPETPSGSRNGPIGTRNDIEDFVVRVEVCDPGFQETEYFKNYCKYYPAGTYKPSGLLQKYAEGDKKVCSKSFKSCNNDNDCNTSNGEICTVDARMFFGLITGSNTNNLSGGVLRKNIWNFTDELVENSTGIFQDSSDVEGSIALTINTLKTVGFSYSNFAYGPWQWGWDPPCGWLTTRELEEGECVMWGNPIAEMLYESTRYFAGKDAPTSTFTYAANDDIGLNLPKPDWGNTVGANQFLVKDIYPSCSKLFNLIISDINPSYDSDTVPGSDFTSYGGDLPDLDVSLLADLISTVESISGNYFIGDSSGNYDFTCTEKNVSGFSNIRGLCPEEPTKQGSYYSASVAYYGKEILKVCSNDPATVCTSDSDCAPPGECSQDKNLTTYSVALSSPVPQIDIAVGDNVVTIVPIGKSVSGCVDVNTYCANRSTLSYDTDTGLTITPTAADAYCPSNTIVDFYVDTIEDKNGSFRINFEDVEQGADHDMDAIVEYDYCVGSECTPAIGSDQVKVSLNSTYASGCIAQVLGFVISGSTEDGTYLPVVDADRGSPIDPTVNSMPLAWEKTFSASGTPSAKLLKNPLWYAAKWGGFEDANNNKIPDLTSEWDEDGNSDPDTYFFVANPLKLEQQLEKAFLDILKRASSGTAVSVLASGEGSGANLLQAVFYPLRMFGETTQTEIAWTGMLQNLWYHLDPVLGGSTVREDTVVDLPSPILKLDEDYIISIYFDSAEGKTKAFRCLDSDGDGDCDVSQTTVDFEKLSNLWEAGKLLFNRTPADRTIYTNTNDDLILDSFSTTNPLMLNAADSSEADWIKAYVSGDDKGRCSNDKSIECEDDTPCAAGGGTCEIPRSRTTTMNINGTEVTNTWKLGDIINSTPRIQSTIPLNNYHITFKDASYRRYINDLEDDDTPKVIPPFYKERGMVYAGANDGMLHAFNLGKLVLKWDGQDKRLEKAKLEGTDLGKEEWAFIPKNVLPYLKYLKETDYCHLYYVDASPYLLDASIGRVGCAGNYWDCDKTADTWRTVLIGSMRLGGGCRGPNDPTYATCTDCVKTPAPPGYPDLGYSSYFALDITNPDDPKLLWEFSDGELGFSNTGPLIVRIGAKDKNGRWIVALASGPTGPIDTVTHEFLAKSDQNLKIFILDLAGDGTGNPLLLRTIDTGITEAFGAASFNTPLDLDLNYQDDVFYLGYVEKVGSGVNATWTGGGVLRIVTKEDSNPANWDWSTLIDGIGPVTTTISHLQNKKTHSFWLFFGTGRYFYKTDDPDSKSVFYGVKEPCYNYDSTGDGIPDPPDNINTACTNPVGALVDSSIAPPSSEPSTGWYINLDCSYDDASCGCNPSIPADDPDDVCAAPGYNAERIITHPLAAYTGAVFFTTFSPTADVCAYGGNTYLWAIDYKTGGLAPEEALLGKALLQVSTGEIKEIDLKSAFTERKPSGETVRGRRTQAIPGVPPTGQGLSVIISPRPLQRIEHMQER